MVKLSVITVNLNNSTGLQKTIESVINQTFYDIEYLIVDGGSTDGSTNIIKQYSGKISYSVSEPDYGIYNAINKGIKQASGEYCLFLNSGDWLCNENVLQSVFNTSTKEDILYGNSFVFIQKNVPYLIEEPEDLTFLWFYKHSICHQAMFIKRELFNENRLGLYREGFKIVSDWEFNIRAIILGKCSVKHLAIPVVYMAADGISSTNSSLSLEERKKVFEELMPERILNDYSYFVSLEDELAKIKRTKYFRIFRKLKKLFSKEETCLSV